ncbi:MAG: Smr/MutS family protein [Gemmatimonadales bacterium]
MTEVARTPSSFEQAVAETAVLAELEFDRALAAVARYAVSELGAAAVRSRRPAADPTAIREELATTAELQSVLAAGQGFDPRAVPDIRDGLDGLRTPGSVLESAQLVSVADTLQAMREVAGALRALEQEAPRVASLAVSLPPKKLEDAVRRALEPDGRVKDDASPELKRVRRRIRETRETLVRLLERVRGDMGSDGGEVTLRGDRYVVPVRREDRSRVSGIVHGESGSGATLFVEPAEAVELGNDLAQAQAEEGRAVLAVLRGLTDELRPHVDRLEAGWRMCVRADDLYARARYAAASHAEPPTIIDGPGTLRIVDGAHPILLAETETVVRFHLELRDGHRTVVVSGPNAGGKTVLLKAMGLIAALAQSGVIPPVGKGTTLPVFRAIFSDIGDHQSLAESLSTFSAHVATLKRVLERADDASLALLDELGGGTDPTEGAALAGAVLRALHERRAVTIATTHLGALKELAAETPGVVNASLAFDGDTLAPTYQFTQGKPGRSYGLAIARRLGFPDDVLAVAEALTPEEARTLEATLADVERREAILAEREVQSETLAARLERDRGELASQGEALQQRLAELHERERELERSGREQARRFLLEARRRVEQALGIARAAVSEATAKEARRLVEEGVREEGEALKRLEDVAGKKGWKVKGGKGNGEWGMVEGRSSTIPHSRFPIPDATEPPAASEIDIRGLRVDEAERELIAALDAAVVAELPQLRVIHGKGTGALRTVVRELVERDRRVAQFRLAPPAQGGSGVTIVDLGS